MLSKILIDKILNKVNRKNNTHIRSGHIIASLILTLFSNTCPTMNIAKEIIFILLSMLGIAIIKNNHIAIKESMILLFVNDFVMKYTSTKQFS